MTKSLLRRQIRSDSVGQTIVVDSAGTWNVDEPPCASARNLITRQREDAWLR